MKVQNSKCKIQNYGNLPWRTFNFFIVFLTFNFCLLTLPAPVLAQDGNIGKSQINASSPLYFLKSLREILEIKFAGTTNVRAYRTLEFATRRIREVNSLVKTSREDLIEPTLVKYLSELQELKGITNIKDEDMVMRASQVSGHMEVLQKIYSQVSDPKAKRSIRATIHSLTAWEQQFIDRLDLTKQSAIAQRMTGSKLSACNFLSKEASASALNEVEKAVLAERAQKCLEQSPK
ncbi:hypothetical protein HYU95_06015 [Candidatus Daviesbacteria bacterium]|nr:hypothetical protein [Candidatus Daviesbacteria bacterium]